GILSVSMNTKSEDVNTEVQVDHSRDIASDDSVDEHIGKADKFREIKIEPEQEKLVELISVISLSLVSEITVSNSKYDIGNGKPPEIDAIPKDIISDASNKISIIAELRT